MMAWPTLTSWYDPRCTIAPVAVSRTSTLMARTSSWSVPFQDNNSPGRRGALAASVIDTPVTFQPGTDWVAGSTVPGTVAVDGNRISKG